MKTRNLDDLKGKDYRRATVDGVEYKVKYNLHSTRPHDVQQFDKGGNVIRLSRATRKRILNVLEERMLKRTPREEIGIGEGPYDAEYDPGFGIG